ncbi:MAG: fluoride efflux transporter FluC [Actinomycetes bacterium]
MLAQRWDVLGVVAGGGALGSAGRWWLAATFPHEPDAFPWATFWTNVSGGFALGALMVLVTEVWPPSRYLRPFLGVGVLGGFTTFSTYMLDTRALLVGEQPLLAGVYLFGTLLAGLLAVWSAMALTRTLVTLHGRRGRRSAAQPEPTGRQEGR